MIGLGSLADYIEGYLKQLFEETAGNVIEIQRSELARKFGCAPSQINYVLSTRFTIQDGYIVESRRGGGGYIRVFKVRQDIMADSVAWVQERLGDEITPEAADRILEQLQSLGLLNEMEKLCIKSVLAHETDGIPRELSDVFRAKLLKGLLIVVLTR